MLMVHGGITWMGRLTHRQTSSHQTHSHDAKFGINNMCTYSFRPTINEKAKAKKEKALDHHLKQENLGCLPRK